MGEQGWGCPSWGRTRTSPASTSKNSTRITSVRGGQQQRRPFWKQTQRRRLRPCATSLLTGRRIEHHHAGIRVANPVSVRRPADRLRVDQRHLPLPMLDTGNEGGRGRPDTRRRLTGRGRQDGVGRVAFQVAHRDRCQTQGTKGSLTCQLRRSCVPSRGRLIRDPRRTRSTDPRFSTWCATWWQLSSVPRLNHQSIDRPRWSSHPGRQEGQRRLNAPATRANSPRRPCAR